MEEHNMNQKNTSFGLTNMNGSRSSPLPCRI